jgi:uncharacterized protein YbjQ (UPF0145 family)
VVKQSYRKKADDAAKNSIIIGRIIKYAKSLDYCTQAIIDDLNDLAERYKADAVKNLDLSVEESIQKEIAKAKKAAEPKFGNQN